MSEKLLEMKKISKIFPGCLALDEVNFELKKGEVHVLIGENGAGKSTLIKILSGVYDPDEGEIFVEGKKVNIKNPSDAHNLGIRVIYQELNLIPNMTIYENIFLGEENKKNIFFVDKKKDIYETHQILSQIGMDIDPQALIKDLGVAQKQMIEIAKAIKSQSKILVFDEPTATLSQKEIRILFNLIKKLKKNGVGIIYISHRMEEIKEIGDRCTVLRDGKYIGTRFLNETTNEELIKMMVGREMKFQKRTTSFSTEEKVLEVKNLNFKNKVKNVSFFLKKGEILGVSGLIGSGRTEIAKTIIGDYKRDSGDIYIRGKRMKQKSNAESINNGIFYLSEDRKNEGLFLMHDVIKNITISNLKKVSPYRIINKKKEKAYCKDLVYKLNIKCPSLETLVLNLSGGNQQKVLIGRALFRDASIYIFDEPTRGIDVAAKEEIYRIMIDLIRYGGSIIFISSDLSEILRMSDRIMVIKDGCISKIYENNSKISQEEILASAIGG